MATEKAVIKTGVKTYDIFDESGYKYCTLRFIPTDFNILERYEKVKKTFEEMAASVPDDRKPTIEEMAIINKRAGEEMGYLIGYGGSCKEVFECVGAFTPISNSGQFFVENVMDFVMSKVKEELENYKKKSSNTVRKHTKDYIKNDIA